MDFLNGLVHDLQLLSNSIDKLLTAKATTRPTLIFLSYTSLLLVQESRELISGCS